MPGYCVAGTVGAKVLSGAKVIEMEGSPPIHVRLAVEYLSFSAHADAKGIMQLIKQADAQNVVLVHGEKKKMDFLATKINKELGRPCYFPANGQSIEIATPATVAIKLSRAVLKRGAAVVDDEEEGDPKRLSIDHVGGAGAASAAAADMDVDPLSGAADAAPSPESPGAVQECTEIEGILLMKRGEDPMLVGVEDVSSELGLGVHALTFSSTIVPPPDSLDSRGGGGTMHSLGLLHKLLVRVCDGDDSAVRFTDTSLHLESIGVRVGDGASVHVSWSYVDDDLAQKVLAEVREEVETAAWLGEDD